MGLITTKPLVYDADSPDAKIQGLYEGTCKDARGAHKLEARVVAQGGGVYKVFIRQTLPDGKVAKIDGIATTRGEKVSFKCVAGGVEWNGVYAHAAFTGGCGEGCTLHLKRVQRKPPTLGKKPPSGAIVLLGGKNPDDELVRRKAKDGTEPPWNPVAADGSMQITKGGWVSKRLFDGSFNLHVEFQVPFMPTEHGQKRGNSGVYLPNGDEIQVLDSFGDTTYLGGGCGGLYRYKDPDAFDTFSLASLPPLEWQTYDVEYRVSPGAKPHVTVYHNGIKIHDNVELKKDAKAGAFHFQDHGNPVRYRNIWVLPVVGK
ncbi:MAG: DUF1080 domain-containing protein [Verrucomicrobiae bacterium]|nr:DUF1080 domain-containing protein [Verrucomicrobiae bacterium]